MLTLEKYQPRLRRLCAKNRAVRELYLFGSALTDRFDETASDVDVWVETADLPPEEKGENLLALWNDLESLFLRKVDLLTAASTRNPILLREIARTRKRIYAIGESANTDE